MTYKRSVYSILLFSALLLLFSCSPYQKLLRSNDITLKYNAALGYYDKADYMKALPLLEDIFKFYIGTEKAEKIDYMLSYCYYKEGEYSLGAYQFKNFADAYPLSPYAEEASYYYAYCLFLDSPEKDLDQTSTTGAINAFQLYLDKYPGTKHIDDCNKDIDILNAKLEEKAIDNAVLYYNIEEYKAAVWAIRNVLQDYPSTQKRERLEYIMVKASYLFAVNSIDSKKLERFSSTVEYYKEFKENFPVSKYDGELATIVKNANRNIKEINAKKHE